MSIAGAATPTAVLRKPPTTPAVGAVARPRSGNWGGGEVAARARGRAAPMTSGSEPTSTTVTSGAAGTEPTTMVGAIRAKRRQSMSARMARVRRRAEATVVTLVSSTPATGPTSSTNVGDTTIPVPIPLVRWSTPPSTTAHTTTSRVPGSTPGRRAGQVPQYVTKGPLPAGAGSA